MANRSIIITGAASGIGAACAQKFASNGDHLTLVDIDEEKGRAMADRLTEKNANVSFVAANITRKLDVHNVIAEAMETSGRIDALVHAAITYYSATFLETSEDEFTQILQGNVLGAFLINQAVAKQMIRQIDESDDATEDKVYSIVNIGTTDSVVMQVNHVAFAASQGGVHQLTKGIALALSPHKIRVNMVGIGVIRGETGFDEESEIRAPLNRIGEPEDVANVAYFLSSDGASFVTGQTVFVDGGQSVRSSRIRAKKP